MEYRELNYEQDIEDVVSLIRRNLNSDYSPEILKWKHIDSPFGRSLGLVAVENEKIVGVVFAALYVFQNKLQEKFTAIRFFDACTDSDQRGKGIFKGLMAKGFQFFHDDYDFSLSNPNKASLKGHLRVGYKEPCAERFYNLGLLRPKIGSISGEMKRFEGTRLDEKPLTEQNIYLAGNNRKFINWRYRENKYHVFEFHHNNEINYVVYRIEVKNKLRVIVLCNYFGDEEKINLTLNKVCRKEKTFLIYYLQNRITDNIKFLFTQKYKRAVIVFKDELNKIPSNLVIALGDLEGRL